MECKFHIYVTLAFEFTYIGKENPTMTSRHYDNIVRIPIGDPQSLVTKYKEIRS